MTKGNIKKMMVCFVAFAAPYILLGGEIVAVPHQPESLLNINFILAIVSVILLLPLYLSSKTFLMVAKETVKKKLTVSQVVKKTGVLIFLFCISHLSFAQAIETTIKPTGGTLFTINSITWMLVIIIILEAILIVYFSFLTNGFFKQPAPKVIEIATSHDAAPQKSWLVRKWEKMNRFQPLTAEGQIDTGHSYDGIRELDNITPPWFTAGFIISIIIAVVYLYVYHVSKSAPLQIEEFNIEMAEAEKEKAKLLAIQGNNVDENTVIMLGLADIENGKQIFAQKCIACHQAHGGSMAGGVGPNLTDDYWLHGGSLKDIFKTVKYGWVEKGMIAWQDQLSSKQIAQVSSFIKSIKGSNPAGAKEPQGELYSEKNQANETVVKDSTAIDSTNAKNK